MANVEEIVAVKKNSDGDIEQFKTSSGKVLTYTEALNNLDNGLITGVNKFKGKDGKYYIRSNRDGQVANNLDHLPIF